MLKQTKIHQDMVYSESQKRLFKLEKKTTIRVKYDAVKPEKGNFCNVYKCPKKGLVHDLAMYETHTS